MKSSKPAAAPKVFLLSGEDSIIVFRSAPDAQRAMTCGDSQFDSLDQLDQLTTGWPSSRLVALWNNVPGVTKLKKFTDRATALKRIWNALQSLEPVLPEQADPPTPEAATGKAKPGTKKAMLLSLLNRPEGASVHEIMAALGWQSHSVRGCLSSLSRQGTGIHSFRRPDGGRAYSTNTAPTAEGAQ